jgi:nitrogen regulatory protein P-II 1
VKKVEAIVAACKLDAIREQLVSRGCEGLVVTEVHSHGEDTGRAGIYRGSPYALDFAPKVKLEVVVADEHAILTAYTIIDAARAGRLEDGTVTIVPVEETIRIRTGERGPVALHSERPRAPRLARAANG